LGNGGTVRAFHHRDHGDHGEKKERKTGDQHTNECNPYPLQAEVFVSVLSVISVVKSFWRQFYANWNEIIAPAVPEKLFDCRGGNRIPRHCPGPRFWPERAE
jgi:hypothetical protein